MTVDGAAGTADLVGTTTNAVDGTVVTVEITDSASGSVTVSGVTVTSDAFSVTSHDISSLVQGLLTVTTTIDDNRGGTVSATDSQTYTI